MNIPLLKHVLQSRTFTLVVDPRAFPLRDAQKLGLQSWVNLVVVLVVSLHWVFFKHRLIRVLELVQTVIKSYHARDVSGLLHSPIWCIILAHIILLKLWWFWAPIRRILSNSISLLSANRWINSAMINDLCRHFWVNFWPLYRETWIEWATPIAKSQGIRSKSTASSES